MDCLFSRASEMDGYTFSMIAGCWISENHLPSSFERRVIAVFFVGQITSWTGRYS